MYSHLKNVELGTLCKWGHDHGGGMSWRKVTNGTCVTCERERVARWAKSHKGVESRRKTKEKRKHVSAARMREYRKENSQKMRAYNRRYRLDNRDWFLSYYRSYNAARKAALIAATPKWSNFDEIKSVYARAHRTTVLTGNKHVVDHIVPLVSKRVCGLHVPENLRVISEHDNCVKGNRWWPDGLSTNEHVKTAGPI